MMKTSQVIDDLQFKFLSENEKDDDFNLAIIAETFKALAVKIKPLKTENKILELNELSSSEIADELSYANKSLKQFKEASVKGVVSENVMNMLYAFHEGMAKEYNLTHTLWDADTLNSFAMSHLMSYWTPVWDSLDGIGGEVKSYLNFLSQKKRFKV